MSLERIREIVNGWKAQAKALETSAILARAEENMPIAQPTSGKIEPKVLAPVTPIPSQTGGFRMSEAEKAAARKEAIGGIFSI